MSFTSSLYYPHVDVPSASWLKNAALYWDKISTIVPRSVEHPYELSEAIFLQERDILSPIRIDSSSMVVQESSRQLQQYIQRPEGLSILVPPSYHRERRHQWEERDFINKVFLYPEKLADELREQLLSEGHARRRGDHLELERGTADYYMTVLAGNLANHTGLALLTSEQKFDSLANLARRKTDDEFEDNVDLRQSLLAQMVVQSVKIAPHTPIEKIVEFREKHRDELGLFRQEIGRLAEEINKEWVSWEGLQQSLHDTYVNQVSPSINNLKGSLNGFGIQFTTSNLMNILYASSLSLLPAQLLEPHFGSLAAPIALLAGAGISIIASTISHRVDRQNMLRENPYSYVLAAENTFR